MNAVVKIALMVFLSVIFMLLAAYSTIFKARAVRCTVVYEIVAFFLIISDGKLMLGIIEFVIFQIMAIFSAIGSLYAYAEIDIKEKQKNGADENCTTLVVLPIKKQDVEVTLATINSMGNLVFGVFLTCVCALFIFRPALLFPYYGKNAVIFMFALAIIVNNFLIADDTSTRAAESAEEIAKIAFYLLAVGYIFFGFAQFAAFVVYDFADIDAKERTRQMRSEAEVTKLCPINKAYGYDKQLPSDVKIVDETYVAEVAVFDRHTVDNVYYYFSDNSYEIEKVYNANIFVSENVTEPYLEIEQYYYVNLEGEEVEDEKVYNFHVNKEQIITY